MGTLYSCEDVANRYKVDKSVVWYWIRNKKLPAIKIGKEYRIDESDLMEFERSRRTT